MALGWHEAESSSSSETQLVLRDAFEAYVSADIKAEQSPPDASSVSSPHLLLWPL